MNEIEVKFLEIDKKKVIAKLLSLGAKKHFEGKIEFSYFDNDYLNLKSRGKVLRLRKKGKIVEFCFKQKMKSDIAKSFIETEVVVSDYDKLKKILTSIGFVEMKKPVKYRVSYRLKNYNFEFDKFSGMPTYLEVEANSEKELKKAVELIGLDMKDAKPWSMSNVFRYYKKKY